MKKRDLLFLFLLQIFSILNAQSVKGSVLEFETNKPILGVKIMIENTGIWTVTDQSGNFEIKYNSGETLIFSRAGLIQEKRIFSTIPSEKIVLKMQFATIRINEVALSVKKKNYSEIEIKEEALKNIQAFSLNEILEQIPGQKLQNLKLNEFKPIVFRSIVPDNLFSDNQAFGNKSFGTSIVVDGIPLSNNENMQSYVGNYGQAFSPNLLGFGVSEIKGFNGYFSNANYGADLREIPVENIESVEVVQGIPSAKYGDLTSGLINIQQKSGVSPYRIYSALRNDTQEFNFNKGFEINNRLGFLNVNLNYLKLNSDPRTKFNVYERITGMLMWTYYNKNKNVSNSLSVEYGNNLDHANFEEEDTDMQLIKNKKRDLKISNRFNWRFKNSFFDNFNANANYSQGYQNTYESKFVNVGGEVVANSIEEGVYTATYTPVNYKTIKEVEGKPVSLFFSADLKKNIKTSKNWVHNILIGASAKSSDNKGEGRKGSPETIINQFGYSSGSGGIGFRPYNFGENVRAEYQFSLYTEDNIFKKLGNNTVFNLNAGLRYDNQYGSSVLQPRINTYLIYRNFKFRGGFGIASKAPSINMIYTGPRYHDAVLADVRLPGYYNLAVAQTFIDYSNNENLKPSKSYRSEIGLDYKFSAGNINITAYYNQLVDGIANENFAVKKGLATLQINDNGTNIPTYDVTGYTDYYYLHNHLINSLKSSDKGIELLMSLNKLPVRNISVEINGSYVKTNNNSNTDSYYRSEIVGTNEIYGLYRSYNIYYKQLILNGALNYHLPKAGLVVSLRTQHFIISDTNYNEPQFPYAYINQNLEKIFLTQQQMNDSAQFANIKKDGNAVENTSLQKIYHNFNLKISKDFLNGFKFSFYANNFLDLKQTYITLENGKYVTMVKPDLLKLSFGAKIEYQF